ncbi:S41 family peptidase [Myroides sp. LJL119]
MRKKLLVFCLLSFQVCLCQISSATLLSDLDFVYQNLQQSSSYLTQKNKQALTDQYYQELKNTFTHESISQLRAYLYLYELVDHITDYHNDLIGHIVPKPLSKTTPDSVSKSFSVSDLNLDSLNRVLRDVAFDNYMGIYHYDHKITVGVFQESPLIYQAVVLDSKLDNWQKAEIIFYLLDKGNNRFRLVTKDLKDKSIFFSGLDLFKDGEFQASKWTKVDKGDKKNYANKTRSAKVYDLVDIDSSVSYLKLGSFAVNPNTLKKSKEFYNQLKQSKINPVLIVDLRNNTGGGQKNSRKYEKFLRKYSGKIIVLVNFNTVSNAEQFVLRLQRHRQITIAGNFTKGTITYGRNYGSYIFSPSLNFKLSFTDLKDNWKMFLPYEGVGIKPDVILKDDMDWVSQVLILN